MKGILIATIIVSSTAIIAFFPFFEQKGSSFGRRESVIIENPSVPPIPVPDESTVPEVTPELPESITHIVPFTSQAPSAQWSDPVFQNACEEASIIMAAAWTKDKRTLPEKSIVERDIRSISADAEKRFGEKTYDTSAEDTATLFREYSGSEATVRYDVTLDEITDAVRRGSILIAPFDGRKLGNPNYTAPGPTYHMLVIIGYDAGTEEFVTNDPGTRHGASYRYDQDILFGAIRDYRTGYHLQTSGEPGKNVIVIPRADGPR